MVLVHFFPFKIACRHIKLGCDTICFSMNNSVVKIEFLIDFFPFLYTFVLHFHTRSQCSLVLLAFLVVAINGSPAEKQPENQSATPNAESSVKDKRAIHITSYHAAPYVYHSPVVSSVVSPVVVHHSAPLIHAAPIVHHPVVATHAVHPVYTSHVISHAPLVSYHYGRR